MTLIQNNFYQIKGVPLTTTAMTIEKQRGKIKVFGTSGNETKYECDFQITSKLERIKESTNKVFVETSRRNVKYEKVNLGPSNSNHDLQQK
jgi:hypothetical protein